MIPTEYIPAVEKGVRKALESGPLAGFPVVNCKATVYFGSVNGHSYEDKAKHTENTNFALLVSKHFSEPFKDSNGYGESIARLSNMLGGGVMVQRFGDLVRGRRSTEARIRESFVTPTLAATPGDLSLVIPKRIEKGFLDITDLNQLPVMLTNLISRHLPL